MFKEKREIQFIYGVVAVFFLAFLLTPLVTLLLQSFQTGQGIGLANYRAVTGDKDFMVALQNSVLISTVTALITTVLAFLLAYAVNCTHIARPLKAAIRTGILLPMLLPTITYGFAIIYSFGKQGLLTKWFGGELFTIYGFNGLLIGYVIYTLPPAFLLLDNSFKYIDKKFMIVAELMGDGFLRSFLNTVVRPLIGTLGGALAITFILTFTDFGIPASVGGTYSVIATQLYQVMLGALPNFNNGSAIAMLMLSPAVIGVLFLTYLERFNFHYNKTSVSDVTKNKLRDVLLLVASLAMVAAIVLIFLVMFITPFVTNFPYDMSFTTGFFQNTLFSRPLADAYQNSLLTALGTAVAGTILAYGAAVINVRTRLRKPAKVSIDFCSMLTNTVPGMVLGLAYLFLFKGSDFKGTFAILVICNIVHFFTTPYLMAKHSLAKMSPAWEITGELMGDTWFKTIVRVIIPNSFSTLVEMFSYYFINAMVTISAIIFLVSAQTAVVTSKIKELQHFASFNEIFVLSILIFLTNLGVKTGSDAVSKKLTFTQPRE